MPAQTSSKATRLISRMTDQVKLDISQKFPDLLNSKINDFKHRPQPELPATSTPNSVSSQVVSSVSQSKVMSQITQEELQSVIHKMQSILSKPPSRLDGETSLYLNQQLSELLGIQVSTELDGFYLPHNTGLVKSLNHQKTGPDDKLENHINHIEAGISDKRSFFGWLDQESEQYRVSLPLQLISGWVKDSVNISKWYQNRKVVLINPFDMRAVIAKISDIYVEDLLKYQFGASPEVVREGLFWSPKSRGRAAIFFIEGNTGNSKLSLLDFSSLFQETSHDR